MHWYLGVRKKYFVFEGRARRKEYWLFVMFNLIIVVVLSIIDNVAGLADPKSGYGLLALLYTLSAFMPGIAISVRRLQDTGHSGWWLLIPVVPLISGIVLLVLKTRISQEGQNQYGPNPKEVAA